MRADIALMMVVALIAGAGMACQGGVNSLLARRLDHPLQSALVSFLVGTISLILVTLVWGVGRPSLSKLWELPWYLWTGGLIGAAFVTSMIILTPRLGSSVTISCVIAGQIFASVIMDHFGLLGLPVIPISGQRLLGVVLLLAGVFLIRR